MAYFEEFQKCLKYINENVEEEIDFDNLYRMASMSKTNFQRFFLFLFDMSLQEYIRRLKLKNAAQKLVNSNMSILEIAYLYGYDNQSSFTRACRAEFGKTPKEIRLGNKYTSISPLNIKESMREGCFEVNEKPFVYVREIKNSHVVSFDVDCFDAEEVAWNQLRKWANENFKNKTARKYVGVAPIGHHPEGNHEDASEHVKHPYKAMMFLLDEEANTKDFF